MKKHFKLFAVRGNQYVQFELRSSGVDPLAEGSEVMATRKTRVKDDLWRGHAELRAKFATLMLPMFLVRVTPKGRVMLLSGGADRRALEIECPGLVYPAGHPFAGQAIVAIGQVVPDELPAPRVTLASYTIPSRLGPTARFKLLLRGGDADAKSVVKTLTFHGIHVDLDSGKGPAYENTTRAAWQMLQLHQMLGVADFNQLIIAMKEGWPGQDASVKVQIEALGQHFLAGLYRYIRHSYHTLPEIFDRIAGCAKNKKKTALAIRQSAYAGVHRPLALSPAHSVCRVLGDIFGKLPATH
jgi:hypothetical protein